MLITRQDRIVEPKPNVRGGKGTVDFEHFLPTDKMPAHFRILADTVVEPGCSLGMHRHVGECEFYFIAEGEGLYNDNGKEYTVHAGDMTFCFEGEEHGIENVSDAPLHIIACVITEK